MTTQLTHKRFFRVTLPWNPSNSEEGDYCECIWANDHDAAIRGIAEEMADHPDAGIEEGDEKARTRYIEILVDTAGQFAAEDIGVGLINQVSEFMAGPSRKMSEDATKDFATIKAILARYGAYAG